ncbi:MAG: nucleotide-binding domain containing protein [Nibricoccus sp.]
MLARSGMQLPSLGLIVAEASSPADVAAWASRLQPGMLPAGGADFFQAYLASLGLSPSATPAANAAIPSGPSLIISGTTSAAGETLRENARKAGLPVFSIPSALLSAGESFETSVKTWADNIRRALTTHGIAIVIVGQPVSDLPHVSSAIRRAFARMATLLDQHRAFHHLLVDGGATAAAVTRSLAWHQLSTAAIWAPGVVSLQPLTAPGILLTLKPGSYAWPAPLWEKLLPKPSATSS